MVPPEMLPPRILAALGLLSSSTACACLSVAMEPCLSAVPDSGDTGDTSDPEDSDAADNELLRKDAVHAAVERADLPPDLAARILDPGEVKSG